jgi:hypothetical protein
MKKFIVMILGVATFFIGLGGLIEGVGARFKSDERALELIRLARVAVGGEQSLSAVKSLTITGRATKTFDFDGIARNEQGDWELNLQLPGQISKSLKLRREGEAGGKATVNEQIDVVTVRKSEGGERVLVSPEGSSDKKELIIMRKGDGENVEVRENGELPRKGTVVVKNGENAKFVINGNETTVDGKKVILDKVVGGDGAGVFHRNDLFRATLSLLLTAPEGLDVSYTYAGEGSVDGTNCDIVLATTGGSSIKLYLDKASHIPVMMSYQAPKPFMIKINKDAAKADTNSDVKVLRERMPAHEMAEFQVKFSDYRSVSGVQLPYRWTQTINGKDDEVIEVSAYEINPANIADKFNVRSEKVFVRTAKPQ